MILKLNNMKKKKLKIEESKRRTMFAELEGASIFADKEDYVEVTEWVNGDGVTITVKEANIDVLIDISYPAFDVLKKLVKQIQKV